VPHMPSLARIANANGQAHSLSPLVLTVRGNLAIDVLKSVVLYHGACPDCVIGRAA
jgi:hypothetical protein